MKNKGFTLVELLAVIIILGVLLVITVPIVNDAIDYSKDNAYQNTVDEIIKGAKRYVLEHEDDITGLTATGHANLSLNTLFTADIFSENIKNPKTGEAFSATANIRITTASNGTYHYTFYDEWLDDGIDPTVSFGVNGNATYAKTYNTMVTISDSGGVDTNSLKYQWTTNTNTPTEESFSTAFVNGGTVSSPAGVTGTYYLWILAKDIYDNTTITHSNLFNLDNTLPVITITGDNPIYFHVCMINYSDPGATATDNINGNITGSIQSAIDVYGTHTVTYTVTDTAGNQATAVRTIDYHSGPC